MGRICGYASVFHIPDASGDIVMPGAFAKTLREKPPGAIKMLFHHDPQRPIGVWDEISEDSFGLKTAGTLTPLVSYGNDLERLLQHGAIDGLSIGFKARRAQKPKNQNYRLLYDIDLWEISIVTFPMLAKARVQKRIL